MKLGYALAFVADMPRSVAFYRDVVGLPLKFESSHWTEFLTGGAVFALHIADGDTGGAVNKKAPGQCRPGFAVSDLESFHQRMLDHGVPCEQEPSDVYGVQIAQYLDPDGLVISVSGS